MEIEMTDSTQPEALRLAELLELAPEDGVEPQTTEDAAAELRRQHTRIAELEAQLSSSGFTAADMATASAQGFRDGVASIAASAGSEPVATYSVDADPLSIRSTVAEAITGALAFGAQGVNQPPEGHWLAPFWKAAREDKEAAELAHRDREIDRLRDENTTLQQGYAAARLEIESLQARIKAMAEERADELVVAHLDGRMRASHGQAPAQAIPAAAAGCTRSHPHENMDSACRAKAAIAEMQNMAARGAEATTHDLERFVAMLAAAPTTQPAPQQEAQEPVAWYVTGCNRLLDEDEAKAEARHIGGTARAMPLYTAPPPSPASQADSQPALDEATAMNRTRELAESGRWPSDWVEAYRRGYSDRAARAPADSVLEDAARLDWLDKNIFHRDMDEWDARYGHGDGYNMWVLFAPKGAQGGARSIIDAARKQGANHD